MTSKMNHQVAISTICKLQHHELSTPRILLRQTDFVSKFEGKYHQRVEFLHSSFSALFLFIGIATLPFHIFHKGDVSKSVYNNRIVSAYDKKKEYKNPFPKKDKNKILL